VDNLLQRIHEKVNYFQGQRIWTWYICFSSLVFFALYLYTLAQGSDSDGWLSWLLFSIIGGFVNCILTEIFMHYRRKNDVLEIK